MLLVAGQRNQVRHLVGVVCEQVVLFGSWIRYTNNL